MCNSINDQLSAFGNAQVLVILKNQPQSAGVMKTSAAFAAAIPVATSQPEAGAAQGVVTQLARFFHIGETSTDTSLAAAAKAKIKKAAGANWYKHAKLDAGQTRGVDWYKRAASPTNPTPPLRYYPNLGMILGTVDAAGLTGLKASTEVAHVLAPPVLSLIRPVARRLMTGTPARAQQQDNTWGIKRLRADQLHAQGYTGAGIIVGHLDTGADGTHPALLGAFRAFAEFDGFGFQVAPSPAPHDTEEHGTHTAGTIAGRTVNGRAIGMAPEALLASAIVIEGGNATARVLGGMDWVIGQGARILSMSLGFRGYTEDFLILTQTLRARGVLPVFAVGNDGPGTSRSPGNYAEVLSIGAIDCNDNIPWFSSSRQFADPNFRSVPNLVAPGVGVISAKPGGDYQEMDGTSMATPHIAGLAALLMQASPTADINQIEQAILNSCVPLANESPERQGRGVPDAVRALACLTQASSQAPGSAMVKRSAKGRSGAKNGKSSNPPKKAKTRS